MADTNFNSIVAGSVKAKMLAPITGVKLSKADSYSLAANEKLGYVNVAISAASKALTLGIDEGDVMIVYNSGATNAITVKNLSGDTGTSVAAGKVALVYGSTAANGTSIVVLN